MTNPLPVLVIGGTGPGALEALQHLLSELPPTLPVLILVALSHLPVVIQEAQRRLTASTSRRVALAQEGDVVQVGVIYLARPGRHLVLEADSRLSLPRGERVLERRPAADLLFKSAAACHGTRTIGVVLSGSGQDGVEGLRTIRAAGGITMVQRPGTAASPGMPLNAVLNDNPSFISSPDELGLILGSMLDNSRPWDFVQ
jgi:two-component system chemotaxis response regulator CheB